MRTLRLKLLFAFFFAMTSAELATGERVIKGGLITENIPDSDTRVLEAIKQYHNIRQYQFQGWLFSGALVTTRIGRTPQAYLVRDPKKLRRNKGWLRSGSVYRTYTGQAASGVPLVGEPPSPQQLTFFTEPAREITPSPDGKRFIASRDNGGNEQFQGHLFAIGQTDALHFTDQGYRNTDFVFSSDGQWIAWQRSANESPNWDILVTPLNSPSRGRRVVFQGEGTWLVHSFSPDNRFLLVSRYVSVDEGYIFLLDINTGSLKPINDRVGPMAYGVGKFTNDGKSIIVQSDEGRGFVGLLRIDLASGEKTAISPALDGDVTDFALSADDRFLAYSVNVGGRSKLMIARAITGRVTATPRLPPGVIYGLAFDLKGHRLGFTFDGARHPAGAWVYYRRSGRLKKWTDINPKNNTPKGFRSAELVHYLSFVEGDGRRRQIPAYIYRPQTSARRPVPVIISVHGGPESQYRPRFSPRFQYWLKELGAAIIAPNIRGSTGYGGNFVNLDDGVLREDAIKDIGALLDWIKTQKNLDSSRIVIHGGSYGGYVVLAAMTKYPDQLAGGVDIVGISNFVTFLENTKGYRQNLRRVEYGDERDPKMRAFLNSISPLNHAQKIRAPLLIVQGKNDPRVPASESEQMLAATKANGASVWYMMAEDEGHGFRKSENVLALRAAEDAFFRHRFNNGKHP